MNRSRMAGHRHLVYRRRTIFVIQLATSCRMLYAEWIIREENSGEKACNIEVGFWSGEAFR